ncbi:hypothetical protein GCM10010460_33430 [Microbacterium terrae]|uniref:ComE operon protein 1 n=1 Tax=Microbacterium terrae TaxID=69369 RepID=A0A0M2HLQ9_9MICO|nr:ComE operon protein 1 [Microbacterium terrae]GLJ98873.1 hypothetical protein GCM10017594_20700 [Microbacterium terrae]
MGVAVVVVIVALGVTVLVGVVRSAGTPTETVPLTGASTDAPALEPAEVYVHVSGAVRHPGLYVLDQGARVVDAIAAAGGYADGADGAAVNLARAVDDGEQLHVPMQGEDAGASGGGATGGSGVAGDGRVNLNTADAAALETLPRIGTALAERILAWRDENGRFTSVEDLLAVPGIGEKMLESLRDLVSV